MSRTEHTPGERFATAAEDPGQYTLITGGAGFVGSNLAHRLCQSGHRVLVLDNFARCGVERNWQWLKLAHGDRIRIILSDIRDAEGVRQAVANASRVFHFAAQVAVTTSLTNPMEDFEVNAGGTLNVLEAVRSLRRPPPLVFTSTNKVYGGLEDLATREDSDRYIAEPGSALAEGIDETRPLDFHSPYGCSKGAADQYVRDYARSFGIPTVVFRMSCIYGQRQFGNEDQGWVAHFLIRALENRPITIYGDGKQVRDILFVDDLVEALLLASQNIEKVRGRAFNIGGGPGQTVSLRELIDLIGELSGEPPECRFEDWRVGDQKLYVSNTRAFQQAVGWRPTVGVREGVARLLQWLCSTRASESPR